MKKIITLLIVCILGTSSMFAGLRFMTKMNDGYHYVLNISDDGSFTIQNSNTYQVVEQGVVETQQSPSNPTDAYISFYVFGSHGGKVLAGMGTYHAATCKLDFLDYEWMQLP